MEKLERVQRMTHRRMGQVDSELERLEERPELDTRKRYGSLRKRFEELEKLYYNLRQKQAPGPYLLIERILAAQSKSLIVETKSLVSCSAPHNTLEGTADSGSETSLGRNKG
jgi:hypothetical protein